MIIKIMTLEIVEKLELMDECAAYVNTLKAKTFVRTKTIVDAIMIYKSVRADFWKMVSKTWPETRGLPGKIHADATIVFESIESALRF